MAYSSLNYKDGLAVLGRPGVIRKFPMVPGIDLAGMVVSSSVPGFHEDLEVLVTGCGLSETAWGGYSQYARVDADCVIPLPHGLTMKHAMALGTAGFTAMESILALEEHGLKPSDREVLVTGAAGGVGSCAVAMLAKLGYNVVASSGRAELEPYLRSLGATSIVDRDTIAATAKTGLATERWAGAIDSVGGTILAGIFPAMARGGSVAACGLAQSEELETTVFPFILRGVNLLGINSSSVPNELRRKIWARCSKDMPTQLLDSMTVVEPLENIFQLGEQILAGKIRGRVVIEIG